MLAYFGLGTVAESAAQYGGLRNGIQCSKSRAEADDVWTEELLIEGNPNCRVFNALWVVEPALGEQPRRTKTS